MNISKTREIAENISTLQIAKSSHKFWYWFLAIFVLIRSVFLIFQGLRPFDDTYITFRYALNLAEGHGFVFNSGEHVLGTTTPLWTMMLAGGAKLGLPIPGLSLVLGILSDALSAVLLTSLLTRLKLGPAVSVLASVLFLSQVDYMNLARSGMETTFDNLLILAVLYALVRKRWWLAGGLAGLAILTRPESLLLSLVIFVFVGLTNTATQRLLGWGKAFLGLTLVLLPWLVFSFMYFGSPISQSVAAKAAQRSTEYANFSNKNIVLFFIHGQGGPGILARTYWQASFILTGFALLAVIWLLVKAWQFKKEWLATSVILLLWPFLYLVTFTAAIHAFTYFVWYYGPIYPFLCLLTVIGADFSLNWLSRQLKFSSKIANASAAQTNKLLITAKELLLIGFTLILLSGQLIAALSVKYPADKAGFWVEGLRQAATKIPKDPTVTIAAPEIGVISWESYPDRVDDMAGLTNPATVAINRLDYIKATKPAFIEVRSDEAADFVQEAARSDWFNQYYETVVTLKDPYAAQIAFLLYQARSYTNK